MKNISVELKDHLAEDVTTLVTCWKVIREDGEILGFTDNVFDLIVDTVTYKAATGYTPSNIKSSENLAVDNVDLMGLLSSSEISERDLIAGVYDYAEVFIFMVNYEDLTMGILKLQRGRLGEITIHENHFSVEMRSLTQQLQQTVGEVYSTSCRADLGDARCKVELDPGQWTATTVYALGDIRKATSYDERRYVVTDVTGASTSGATEPTWGTTIGATTNDSEVTWTAYETYTFEGAYILSTGKYNVPSRPTETDYFVGGLLTFTSGDNSGISREVKTDTDGDIVVVLPFPFEAADADTFVVYAGCNKRVEDCKSFSTENGLRGNIYNMRAEPYIPGIDEISKFGGQ
ncbi:MAG: hypothetical protein DRQ45_00090 [Gammaproteobacteria bacterium]|nr:MAG: hypothetical protein DRQ45_00090 [Gammaproteobacteria bacterium]